MFPKDVDTFLYVAALRLVSYIFDFKLWQSCACGLVKFKH